MTMTRQNRALAIGVVTLGMVACGGSRTAHTGAAGDDTQGSERTASDTAAASEATGIDATIDGQPYRLTHGYVVWWSDGSPVVFAASAPLDCASLAQSPSGAPTVTTDTAYYVGGYGDFPWTAGASADGIGLSGGLVGEASLVGFNAPNAHVDVISAPGEAGSRGRVRMIAAPDPDRTWIPTLDGEVDVEVCPRSTP